MLRDYKYHIFALVGESGSGKTTLQYSMRHMLTIPTGLTTRAKREDDIDGQYIYSDYDMLIELLKKDKLCLVNGVYSNVYAYFKDEFNKGHSIVVVDVVGIRRLQEYFGFENVTAIYVESPISIRKARASSRSSNNPSDREWSDKRKFNNAYHLCDYKITNDCDIKYSINELKSVVREVLLSKYKKQE